MAEAAGVVSQADYVVVGTDSAGVSQAATVEEESLEISPEAAGWSLHCTSSSASLMCFLSCWLLSIWTRLQLVAKYACDAAGMMGAVGLFVLVTISWSFIYSVLRAVMKKLVLLTVRISLQSLVPSTVFCW